MIVYNETINVENEVKDEWLLWMKETYIPKVMKSGFFVDWKMLRLINEDAGSTGSTYAIQYRCENLTLLNLYITQNAPIMHQMQKNHFPDKHVIFCTVLEEL